MLRAATALLLCTMAGAPLDTVAPAATGATAASALDELMRDPQKALELVPPELLARRRAGLDEPHGGGAHGEPAAPPSAPRAGAPRTFG